MLVNANILKITWAWYKRALSNFEMSLNAHLKNMILKLDLNNEIYALVNFLYV